MTLWTRFTAWLSGWPESTAQGKKHKHDEVLFAEEEAKIKQRKPKGLNPKKKKSSKKKTPKKSTKTKVYKQGNMT